MDQKEFDKLYEPVDEYKIFMTPRNIIRKIGLPTFILLIVIFTLARIGVL